MVIKNHPFIEEAVAKQFSDRLNHYPDVGVITKMNTIIGAPSDDPRYGSPEPFAAMSGHNAFMHSAFPDLLEKLRQRIGELFDSLAYYGNDVSLPGFNLFTVLPQSERRIFFHFDEFVPILATRHPELNILPDARQYSFTVLLDCPPGLKAGLLYFEDFNLGLKFMKFDDRRHNEFKDFAEFHEYPVGDLNIYDQLVHSVYARNESDLSVKRVTLQGHLVETPRGILIFW